MDRFIDAVRAEGAALAAAAQGNLEASVEACPGWTVRTLVAHAGEVHRTMAYRVATKVTNHNAPDFAPGHEEDLLAWYTAGIAELAGTLAATATDVPVWTWFPPDRTAGFWRRRMAHETAVHRWDAEHAAGSARPIEPWLADDGIDEFLTVHLPVEETPLTGEGETILLAPDDGTPWTITLAPEGVRVEGGEHGAARVTARGTASDVLLVLWRRLGVDRLAVEGDRALLERFLGWMDLS